MQEYRITSLKDITGNPNHLSEEIPIEIDSWLENNFDYKKTIALPDIPEGSLGMLFPKTNIVIITKPFVWEFIKLIVSTWILILTKENKLIVNSALGIPIIDALNGLAKSIVIINEEQGERCVYLSLLKASNFKSLPPKYLPIKESKIIKEHQSIKTTCKLQTCSFFKIKCGIKKKNFKKILLNLEKCNLLTIKDDKICAHI
jgi:hypothetical protein